MPKVFDSSTVITPSLPTLSIASAMASPTVVSPPAEMVAVAAICSRVSMSVAKIVQLATEAPLKQIAVNAGLEGGVVAEKVAGLQAGHGLNAATGDYVDMIAEGIIDPAKVTRSALQNAASIAKNIITTECVVVTKPDDMGPMGAPPQNMGGMGSMGGMM